MIIIHRAVFLANEISLPLPKLYAIIQKYRIVIKQYYIIKLQFMILYFNYLENYPETTGTINLLLKYILTYVPVILTHLKKIVHAT